jgi:hypothetical protein
MGKIGSTHEREEEHMQGFGGGSKKERAHWVDLEVNGRIFEWILKKQDGVVWTGSFWLRIGTSGWFL